MKWQIILGCIGGWGWRETREESEFPTLHTHYSQFLLLLKLVVAAYWCFSLTILQQFTLSLLCSSPTLEIPVAALDPRGGGGGGVLGISSDGNDLRIFFWGGGGLKFSISVIFLVA